jgi:hypothetical protein
MLHSFAAVNRGNKLAWYIWAGLISKNKFLQKYGTTIAGQQDVVCPECQRSVLLDRLAKELIHFPAEQDLNWIVQKRFEAYLNQDWSSLLQR